MRGCGVLVLASVSFSAFSAPPIKTSVAGISLREPASSIVSTLERRHPGCEVEKTKYVPDELGASSIASLSINSYTSRDQDACTASQAQSGRVDRWDVSFVHSSVDAASPAYNVRLDRWIQYSGGAIKARTDELLTQLVKEYGQPTEVRHSTRPAAGTARERATGKWYETEIFWQKAMPKKGQSLCERSVCGETLLTVRLSGEGRVGLTAKSAPVEHVSFSIEDKELADRQISWIVDMNSKAKNAALQF